AQAKRPSLDRVLDELQLVQRRIDRHRREQREVGAALAPEDGAPQLLVLVAEDVLALRRDDDPALRVELPGTPPRVPREDSRAARHLGRDLDLGVTTDEADVLEDRCRRLVRIL